MYFSMKTKYNHITKKQIISSTILIKWSLISAHPKLVTYNDILILKYNNKFNKCAYIFFILVIFFVRFIKSSHLQK